MAASAEVEMQGAGQDETSNDNLIPHEEEIYDGPKGRSTGGGYGEDGSDTVPSGSDTEGSDTDPGDFEMAKFLDGDRPTGAEGQSQNVPKKVVINPWCISTSIIILILVISILLTMFAPKLFESLIQNMLHYMVDENMHNQGQGGFEITNLFMMFFAIFNTAVFAMCGNIDYLLMVSCGYLYGDDQHEWLTGAAVYLVSNYIGCAIAFAIGRALFKDRLYFIFSKHEKYRYFQRVFTDHSLLV